MNKEKILYQGRQVGEIDYSKKCFVTFRNDTHFFRNFQGFGASIKLIDLLLEKGIDLFIINYNNEECLWVDTVTFITKGKPWTDGEDDEQLILHIHKWNRYNKYKDIPVIKYKKQENL